MQLHQKQNRRTSRGSISKIVKSSVFHSIGLQRNRELMPKYKAIHWASLVVQRTRIRLPMQGTWVQSVLQEDATSLRVTKPMRHNYWSPCAESLFSEKREATSMRKRCTTMKSRPHLLQLEKTCDQQRPITTKNKIVKKKTCKKLHRRLFALNIFL